VPLYEYECLKCGRRTERIENHRGPHLKKCPHCGGKVERLLAPPAIQFKGGGWYVTDYASKGAAGGAEKADQPTTKEPAETKAGKESSAGREKKPAGSK
jgi:putative FmdB family regulatory protein